MNRSRIFYPIHSIFKGSNDLKLFYVYYTILRGLIHRIIATNSFAPPSVLLGNIQYVIL